MLGADVHPGIILVEAALGADDLVDPGKRTALASLFKMKSFEAALGAYSFVRTGYRCSTNLNFIRQR